MIQNYINNFNSFQVKNNVDSKLERLEDLLEKIYREYARNGGLDLDNNDVASDYFKEISGLFDTVEHINENKYLLDHLEYGPCGSTGDRFYGLVPLLLDNCKDYHAKTALLALINTDRFKQLTDRSNIDQDIKYMKYAIEKEHSSKY